MSRVRHAKFSMKVSNTMKLKVRNYYCLNYLWVCKFTSPLPSQGACSPPSLVSCAAHNLNILDLLGKMGLVEAASNTVQFGINDRAPIGLSVVKSNHQLHI